MLANRLKLKPLSAPSDEWMHIDLLRVFACYVVILTHFKPYAQGSLTSITDHFRHFTVAADLFLVISGFMITCIYASRLTTVSDYRTFLLRRFARIAPLHWATLLIFVGLGLFAAAGQSHGSHIANFIGHSTNYDWDCLIPNILALQAFGVCKRLTFNYVSWSISAEMGMYMIAPVLIWVGLKSKWWSLALSLVTIAVLFWISQFTAEVWYQWSWDFGVFRALPDFALGAAMFFFRQQIGRIPAARAMLLLTLLAYLIGSLLDWPDPVLLAVSYSSAVAAIACDLKGARRDWISALGVYGQLTYSMYMLHPIMIVVLVSALGQRILHLGGTMMNIWLLLVLALIAPVSYLSMELFETPARRLISGVRFRRRRPAPPVAPPIRSTLAAVGNTD